MEEMPYTSKPCIYIDTKQFPDLPNLPIGSKGTLEVSYEVTGISKSDDEFGDDSDVIHYTLEIEVLQVKSKKMSLEEAGERASTQPLLTKNNINPAP